ncbi:MAG: AarF/UbiB family protein [Dysgonomonas sp.]|nr:AarF/UbiB family protein [Dysgonomonas sp.]
MDNVKKIRRTAQLVTVLTKYGFETIVTQTGIKKLIPDNFIEKDEKRKETFSLTIYERIRLVLEELGPAYIKLGQLLSNRDDILPVELTTELQKLQDNVSVKNLDIVATLQEELIINTDEVFESIDPDPIAAASLSQVYTAVLKENNKKVIIKVKKKGILSIIEADILIMRDFAAILERYYDTARKIGLSRIVSTFDRSIMAELSFVQELANIERFRRNFRESPDVYVPVTYPEYSNTNILCMEYIDGIKISDKEKLIACGLDAKDLAFKVVDLYLKQTIDHGFFHADPHSGNIFVLEDSRIVFIDYGSMGKMTPMDMEALGNFIIFAVRKDMKRLIRVIKKIAIRYNIQNETQLERDLYEFIDLIDNISIKELDMNDISKRFSRLLNENQTVLPEYIYLLVRGIVLLEGVGRELGIETNILENVRPYGMKLIRTRLSPKYITNKVVDKVYDIADRLEELPEDTHILIQKLNNNELEVKHNVKGLEDMTNALSRLVIAILISSLALGSCILILANMPPVIYGVSLLGGAGIIFSGFMATIVLFRIIRNKKSDY